MSGGSLDVIVVGAGRVGRRTAIMLSDHGHSVTVVERDRAVCESLSQDYVAQVIEGDATRPDVLRQADPASADAIAALTGNTGANLGICVSALREIDEEIRTVLRVDTDAGESYEELVDQVVYPERLGAIGAVNAITGSAVRALEDVTGDLTIVEIRVAEAAPVAGRPLSEIALPRGAIVVSDAAIDRVASAETHLEPGETYVVAMEPDVAEEVTHLFRG